jgi:integrase/recombinase XerD
MLRRMELLGLSPVTIVNYARPVRDLLIHTGALPEELSADDIIEHLHDYRQLFSIGSSALNIRICGIKFLYREVLDRPDFALNLPNPRHIKQIGTILTEDELLMLFDACTGSPKRLALLHTLYATGIRVLELSQLRQSDFDRNRRLITIRHGSKGGHHRVIPYDEALRDTLNTYFRTVKPKEWLFNAHNKMEPIATRGVQFSLREVVKKAGLEHRGIHPHTFRHTFAVHYLNNGGNLLRLQQLLGHAHLSTTLLYLRYVDVPLHDIPSPLYTLLQKQRGQ